MKIIFLLNNNLTDLDSMTIDLHLDRGFKTIRRGKTFARAVGVILIITDRDNSDPDILGLFYKRIIFFLTF